MYILLIFGERMMPKYKASHKDIAKNIALLRLMRIVLNRIQSSRSLFV